jgi:uncharacterized protein (TIGR02266 family)
MTKKDQPKQKILVVGLERGAFSTIDALLNRSYFTVDRVLHGESGLALAGQVAFNLLIVKHPLPDMDTGAFVATLRRPAGASATSQLLAVAEPVRLNEVRPHVRGDLGAVLSVNETATVLEEVAARLLRVPPRRAARLVVHLRARLQTGEVLLMCQTENVSLAGMLVRTDQLLPIGTRVSFRFSMPGDRDPFTGEAEVVRHTVQDVEKTLGIGLRFVSLPSRDAQRLGTHLDSIGRGT